MLIKATTVQGRPAIINVQYVQNISQVSAEEDLGECISIAFADSTKMVVKGTVEGFLEIVYPKSKGIKPQELKLKEDEEDQLGIDEILDGAVQ